MVVSSDHNIYQTSRKWFESLMFDTKCSSTLFISAISIEKKHFTFTFRSITIRDGFKCDFETHAFNR